MSWLAISFCVTLVTLVSAIAILLWTEWSPECGSDDMPIRKDGTR